MIQFTIPTIPVAQPRQRHRVIAAGPRQFVQNYTPAKHPVNAFKAAAQLAASQHVTAPLDGPLSMWVTFVFPRPASKIRKRGPNPRYPHTSRPDLDNLCKSLKDALKGIAWRDDAQVWWLNGQKFVASADEQPRVEVRIEQ